MNHDPDIMRQHDDDIGDELMDRELIAPQSGEMWNVTIPGWNALIEADPTLPDRFLVTLVLTADELHQRGYRVMRSRWRP